MQDYDEMEDYEDEEMAEEPLDLPMSLFSQISMNMDPDEMSNLQDPPGDFPEDPTVGDAGVESYSPASMAPSAPSDGDMTHSMDPHQVREDLRELLRDRETKRKALQEKYAEENLAMNRGNL